MMNPVRRARKELGFTRDEICKIAGVGYSTLSNSEKGRTIDINSRILRAFESIGYNSEKLQNEYEEYKRLEKKQLLQAK